VVWCGVEDGREVACEDAVPGIFPGRLAGRLALAERPEGGPAAAPPRERLWLRSSYVGMYVHPHDVM